MKNKFHFFLTFLLGMLFVFISIFAFVYSSYFVYTIVILLGLIILVDALFNIVKMLSTHKNHFLQYLIHIMIGILFLLFPQLPFSFVIVIFALYICIAGLSHFITYCYYRKEKVNGRMIFLLASIVFLAGGVSFLLSPQYMLKK